MAEPTTVEEGRLIDDVVTTADRRLGIGSGAAESFAAILDGDVGFDARCGSATSLEIRKEASLVLKAALLDEIEFWVGAHRAFHEARGSGHFEGGKVLAGEKANEVGCREHRLAVD